MLGSLFYLPLLIMNLVWGGLSDRIGRKTILYLGLIMNFICAIVFGTTKSFNVLIAFRFIQGMFGV
jgi:MFS family permease